MNRLFDNNAIKAKEVERATEIAKVIKQNDPHILAICEAANAEEEHNHFINHYLQETGYRLVMGKSRGAQNLVFYIKDGINVKEADTGIKYYVGWKDDIDNDKLKEYYEWEREPLEVVFEINGKDFRVILVHTKSKGVFDVTDFQNFQKISMANRMKLIAQAVSLRKRIEELTKSSPMPMIILGDMNDGPGLDPYESYLGRSFVETTMGSIHQPASIYHNTLWWMMGTAKTDLWTAEFPDPIVTSAIGLKHHVWIDHILVSPDMLDPQSPVRYDPNDPAAIGPRNKKASDHFPVMCNIIID